MKEMDGKFYDDDLCPHCNTREVEIDDMGYFGCLPCMPKLSKSTKERYLDQDLTGQDCEVYG